MPGVLLEAGAIPDMRIYPKAKAETSCLCEVQDPTSVQGMYFTRSCKL